MLLSPQQVHSFQRDGFLLLKEFANSDLCDAIYTKALKHLDQAIEPIESEEEYQQTGVSAQTIRRLRQVYDREETFASWMRDKEMRPILRQLLEDEPVLLLAHHNSIMTKLPQKSSVTSWHQDIRYWHYKTDNLLSVWLSLGDEFLENGLLEFIPGSHKMLFTPDQFDERSSFKDDLAKNQEIISKRVHYNLQKGDVVLFHAKTLHHAYQNKTDKPKVAFVYSLRGVSNKPVKGTRSDFKEVIL